MLHIQFIVYKLQQGTEETRADGIGRRTGRVRPKPKNAPNAPTEKTSKREIRDKFGILRNFQATPNSCFMDAAVAMFIQIAETHDQFDICRKFVDDWVRQPAPITAEPLRPMLSDATRTICEEGRMEDVNTAFTELLSNIRELCEIGMTFEFICTSCKKRKEVKTDTLQLQTRHIEGEMKLDVKTFVGRGCGGLAPIQQCTSKKCLKKEMTLVGSKMSTAKYFSIGIDNQEFEAGPQRQGKSF